MKVDTLHWLRGTNPSPERERPLSHQNGEAKWIETTLELT